MSEQRTAKLALIEVEGYRSIKRVTFHVGDNLAITGEDDHLGEVFDALTLPLQGNIKLAPDDFNPKSGLTGHRSVRIREVFKLDDGSVVSFRTTLFEDGRKRVLDLKTKDPWIKVTQRPNYLPVTTFLPKGNPNAFSKLDSLAQAKNVSRVLFIHQPEGQMSPKALAKFLPHLQAANQAGVQVVYTTTKLETVDWSQEHSVAKISKVDGWSVSQQSPPKVQLKDESTPIRIATSSSSKVQEMLSARRVIIVEGATEIGVWPVVAKKLNIKTKGCVLINAQSISNMPPLIELAESLGVNYTVVHDKDTSSSEHKARNKALKELVKTGSIVVLDSNFENLARIGSSRKNKPARARKWASRVKVKGIPQGIIDAIRFSYTHSSSGSYVVVK